MTDRLQDLSDAGVSIWLDDLSRERLETGNLADLVDRSHVVGVTTNPAIFQGALKNGERYDAQLRDVVRAGGGVDEVVTELTTEDVRRACDVLADVHAATGGVDGRVSIEVSPDLADDTEGTIAQAVELWDKVDRPNLLIKIPGTPAGWPAITAAISRGISVNVTLIFGLDQYRHVMEAYLTGLEQAAQAGHDLSTIHSVASFFVSRVDTEIDARLEKVGTPEALALRGKAGVANARLAFQAFEETFRGPRWEALASQGANAQRPLWASTGVKNPDYPDTLYVTELVTAGTVNTMPEKTLLAVADHGEVTGDTIRGEYSSARADLDALAVHGVDYDDVIEVLISEGVSKFVDAWHDLLASVQEQVAKATV
ncbi:MAG: transaldolase [Nocardioides sp.]|uniref:transaldolase n=1 Tax=Nocardioides sp. TaxID=35761 RepID=UPI003F1280E3